MRRLQTTHLCPQKSQTASTRSQLNVPRKCDLILATPKADVNFSAHTRKRCCITGPRITRSIILYKSVCFREAEPHTSLRDVWFSSFPLKVSMASHWGQVAWITCTGGSLVPVPPAGFCTCCHHMSHMAPFPPHERNKQRAKVDVHGHSG